MSEEVTCDGCERTLVHASGEVVSDQSVRVVLGRVVRLCGDCRDGDGAWEAAAARASGGVSWGDPLDALLHHTAPVLDSLPTVDPSDEEAVERLRSRRTPGFPDPEYHEPETLDELISLLSRVRDEKGDVAVESAEDVRLGRPPRVAVYDGKVVL